MMSNKKQSFDNEGIEYLLEIRRKEDRKRWLKFFFIGIFLIGFLLGGSWALKDLLLPNQASVKQDVNEARDLMIEEKNRESDSILLANDEFDDWPAAESSEFILDEYSEEEFVVDKSSSTVSAGSSSRANLKKIQPFRMQIQGTPSVDNTLAFIIQGYDPNCTYTLDLGNGHKITIREQFTYQYAEPGIFRLNLTAERTGYMNRSIPTTLQIHAKNSLDQEGFIPNREENEDKDFTSQTNAEVTNSIINTAKSREEPILEEPIKASFTQKAMFSGGTKAMKAYLSRKLKYPSSAIKNGIEGKVYVKFIIDQNGEIKNPTITQSLGYGCDEEVLRIIESMPPWIPAKQDNQNAEMLYILPITFSLQH